MRDTGLTLLQTQFLLSDLSRAEPGRTDPSTRHLRLLSPSTVISNFTHNVSQMLDVALDEFH